MFTVGTLPNMLLPVHPPQAGEPSVGEAATGPAHDVNILDTPAAGTAVVRGGFLRVLAYGAGAGLTVISAAVLARYLGPADLGRYRTVLSLLTIVAGVTEAGMTSIGVREYSTLEGLPRTLLLRNLLGLRLALTLLGTLVAVGFALVAGYTASMVLGTALGGIATVLLILQGTYAVPLQAGLRLGWMSFLEFGRQVLTVLFLVCFVAAGAGLAALLGSSVPVAALLIAATVPLVRGVVPWRPRFDREQWRHLLQITLPFAAATAVGITYAYLSVVTMSLVAPEKEVGYFGGAFSMFATLTAIPGMLVASAFPVLARAARDDRDRFDYALGRLAHTALIAGVGMSLVTIAIAPFAVRAVLGADFDPAAGPLQLQGAALVSTFFAALGGYALLSLHAHRSLVAINAVALLVSLVTTLVLGPRIGAEGGSTAILAGETTLALLYARSLARLGHPERLDPALVVKVAVAVAPGIVLAFATGLPALAATVLGAVAFVTLVLVLRALPAEVIEALTGRDPSRS